MSADLRPETLTIELVLKNYERLLRHRIRQFKVSETVDDCFQQIVLAMITPSETLGTSYLQRYNPARGSAQNYVLMFAMQQMMKLHARGKIRNNLLPQPWSLVADREDGTPVNEEDCISESLVPDPCWEETDIDDTIRTPNDLRRLFAGTPHELSHSRGPSGEPRSTLYMLELLLWGGLSVTEIAHRLGVSTSEVYRRFKALRREPRIRSLLEAALSAA